MRKSQKADDLDLKWDFQAESDLPKRIQDQKPQARYDLAEYCAFLEEVAAGKAAPPDPANQPIDKQFSF
jgi:hypothetical protein